MWHIESRIFIPAAFCLATILPHSTPFSGFGLSLEVLCPAPTSQRLPLKLDWNSMTAVMFHKWMANMSLDGFLLFFGEFLQHIFPGHVILYVYTHRNWLFMQYAVSLGRNLLTAHVTPEGRG